MYEINNIKTNLPSDNFGKFEEFLMDLGLPSENIIAAPNERKRMMQQLPQFIADLDPELKKDARYLSKFVAGSAVGLFDAALNYVWNEVTVNLRKKIIMYGLDLFYDSAVGERNRELFQSEEDLKGIKDKTLLDTCRKLELISDIVYKKLCHILTMRNDIGASHYNENSINSFELLGWLQTCVEEVIGVNPSKSALAIKSIVSNLKTNTEELENHVVKQFSESITELSNQMVGNLLINVFGIFVDENTTKMTRVNILLLAPNIWNYSPESIKYDLGDKIGVMKANLYTERAKLAESFLDKCNGKRYLNLVLRITKLSELCNQLHEAHIGWDNYYNEPTYVREIMGFISISEDIPKERERKIIKTILECRIGREVSYCHGVSEGGRQYYDTFFQLLNQEQVIITLELLESYDISCSLSGSIRRNNICEILEILKTPLNSDRVNDLIDYLFQNIEKISIFKTKDYKELKKGLF